MAISANAVQSFSIPASLMNNNFDAVLKNATKENVNERDVEGYTGLMIAATQGNYDIIIHLCSLSADASLYANDGSTALWLAASRGKWNIFEYLLPYSSSDLDVAPIAGDDAGATILWFAARDGLWDLVERLIVTGGLRNLDATAITGENASYTMLYFAIEHQKLNIVQLLVKKGATVNVKLELTPLVYSTRSLEIFRYLINFGKAAIDQAIPEYYLQRSVPYDAKQIRANAIYLFYCIKKNNLTPSNLLCYLKGGANFNQRSIMNNNTPIHMSIESNKISSLTTLLSTLQKNYSHTAQTFFLSARNKNNHTPLDSALLTQYKNKQEDIRFSEILDQVIDLPASTKQIIFQYYSINQAATMILNVIQPIIDRRVFILEMSLVTLNMYNMPFDLRVYLLNLCASCKFAWTPIGKAYVKEAFQRSYTSRQIRTIVENYDRAFNQRGENRSPILLTEDNENVPPINIAKITSKPCIAKQVTTAWGNQALQPLKNSSLYDSKNNVEQGLQTKRRDSF